MFRNPEHLGRFSDDEYEELKAAGRYLSKGKLGHFAALIGDAMLVADLPNLDRLSCAFQHLVQSALQDLEIEKSIINEYDN